MTNGAWLVMFPAARMPAEDAVLATLSKIRGAAVTKRETMEFAVAVGEASFVVTLNDKSWVAIETKEAVERNGHALANRDDVFTYDVRFELLFVQTDMDGLFEPLLSAAEKLAALTNGVIYESDNGVFQ